MQDVTRFFAQSGSRSSQIDLLSQASKRVTERKKSKSVAKKRKVSQRDGDKSERTPMRPSVRMVKQCPYRQGVQKSKFSFQSRLRGRGSSEKHQHDALLGRKQPVRDSVKNVTYSLYSYAVDRHKLTVSSQCHPARVSRQTLLYMHAALRPKLHRRMQLKKFSHRVEVRDSV